MGADPSSRFFYTRAKDEVEWELSEFGVRSLTIVRPGPIGSQGQQRHLAEAIGALVLGLLAPVLPRRLRIGPAARIARVMVDAAVAAVPGERVIGFANLVSKTGLEPSSATTHPPLPEIRYYHNIRYQHVVRFGIVAAMVSE